jgi:acetoin utilization deacetylase AcuC-like enzyme
MKILYNPKFLPHNPGSFAEGPYRIEAFQEGIEETERNGEEYITLVHSEDHLKLVRNSCMNKNVLAEVYLSPESYEAACSAYLTILPLLPESWSRRERRYLSSI